MTGTKHPRWKKPSDADLVNNPGTGTSKGTIKNGEHHWRHRPIIHSEIVDTRLAWHQHRR